MPPPPPTSPFTNLTPGANGESYDPSISDDGRFVVFTSDATNLTADADNGKSDIFLKDRQTGVMRNLTAAGNGDSQGGVISGDGSTVAFYSEASNLTADANNAQTDVFRLTLSNNEVTNLTAFGDDFSGFPAISDTGGTIAFQSYASNVTIGGDADGGLPDIFTRTGSGNVQVTNAGDFFDQPAISGNGLTVGFQAYGAFGGTLNEPTVVSVGAVAGVRSSTGVVSADLDLSDDGTVAAFQTFTQPNGVIQVGPSEVSNPAGAASGPSLTDVGDKVVYTLGDNVVFTNVGGATATIAAGNGPSEDAVLNSTGSVVAFTTYATDLGPADTNGSVGDIYVRI
jgi:hypothetical protein